MRRGAPGHPGARRAVSERPPWTVRSFAELDSTQSEARRALAAGEGPDRVAFVADIQCGGVGRFGRPFESRLGGAWQTLVVADPQRRWSDGRLPPALALTIADALAAHDRPLGLKWPNDLYRGHAKCGGILVERVRGHLLVGVGLNARNEPPPGFARLDLPPETVRVAVRAALDRLLDGWPPRALPDRWARADLLRDRVVSVGGARGRVLGIDDDASLLLVDADGRETRIRTGSVGSVEPPLGVPPASSPSG